MTRFTSRNGSKTTTYVGVEGFPEKPGGPMLNLPYSTGKLALERPWT